MRRGRFGGSPQLAGRAATISHDGKNSGGIEEEQLVLTAVDEASSAVADEHDTKDGPESTADVKLASPSPQNVRLLELDMGSIGAALDTYETEIRPPSAQLEKLESLRPYPSQPEPGLHGFEESSKVEDALRPLSSLQRAQDPSPAARARAVLGSRALALLAGRPASQKAMLDLNVIPLALILLGRPSSAQTDTDGLAAHLLRILHRLAGEVAVSLRVLFGTLTVMLL